MKQSGPSKSKQRSSLQAASTAIVTILFLEHVLARLFAHPKFVVCWTAWGRTLEGMVGTVVGMVRRGSDALLEAANAAAAANTPKHNG
eukprot:4511639-Amphidinium_carterae.1